jgi:aminopeptidase N
MKKILFLLLISNILFAQNEEAGELCATAKIEAFKRANANKNARIQYPGDDKIDMGYYLLKLKVTNSPQYLSGEATLFVKAKQSVNEVLIDLETNMKTDSVKIGSKKVNYTAQNNQLKITLDKQYAQNEVIRLTIWYQGKPNAGAFGNFTFGSHGAGTNQAPAIWSLSEPYGTPAWFPCKDTPADKADSSDVWLTVPANLTGVSNGILTETISNIDNTKTFKWKNRYPISQYLISVAISNYVEYKQYFKYSAKDSMLISNYIYPEQFNANLRSQLDVTMVCMDLFTKKFGQYPFIKEKYGHAQCGFGGGMEHQTCSSMGSFGATLIAHELAHQWFGDKITTEKWETIWINEGFASYSEAIYLESLADKTQFNNFLNNTAISAKRALGTMYIQNIKNEAEIFNTARVYNKGAWVLHMLRGVVGDDTFFKILQTYLTSKHAYSIANFEDFQKIAEEVHGKSLDFFFKQWLYGESYPKYNWNYSVIGNQLKVNILQTANTNPAFFTMPIELRIKTSNSDKIVVLQNNQANQSFDLTVDGTIQDIVFDPNNKILKDATKGQSSTVLSNEEEGNFNFQIQPNPVQNEVVLNFVISKESNVNFELIDHLGRKINSYSKIFKAGNQSEKMNLSKLQPSRYFIRLTTENQSFTKSIIKN